VLYRGLISGYPALTGSVCREKEIDKSRLAGGYCSRFYSDCGFPNNPPEEPSSSLNS
jgi:hypothetical protein